MKLYPLLRCTVVIQTRTSKIAIPVNIFYITLNSAPKDPAKIFLNLKQDSSLVKFT